MRRNVISILEIPITIVKQQALSSIYIHYFNRIKSYVTFQLIMRYSAVFAALLASTHAWMPQDRDLEAFNRSVSLDKRSPALPSYKIRGVNLGGWLLSEPWMMPTEWSSMGCGSACSEFDCVSALGQSQANTAFNTHYSSWITPSTIQDIHNAGLNTIRIPIGYWSMRSLVDSSEHFPEMDLSYLDAVIQQAADLGMFVVMDLHGAPGAQKVMDAFTGQVSFVEILIELDTLLTVSL
jgi:aryl-phospho-beta-D-glucosidase BglC (GH1 family)